MSQKSDGSVIIEAKLALDQYEKDLATMQKQTEGVAKDLAKGIDSSASSAKDAAAGMGKLQNSLGGLVNAYARGNQAAISNVNTFAKQTSILAEQALAYNAVQKAAQEAALAEKTTAEAQVTSLSALLDSLGEQVLARRREIEAMGDTAAGEAALAARTKARQELTVLEQEAERTATLLAKADDALSASSIKLGQSLKAPLGVLPALKAGFTSLWKLLGGFPGIIMTGAAAAISYFTIKQKESSESSLRYTSILKELAAGTDSAATATDALAEKISKLSRVQAGVELREARKEYARIRSELEGIAKVEFVTMDEIDPFAFTMTSFREVSKLFLDGKIQGEEYRKTVDEIGNSLNEAGRKQADALIQASYKAEALTGEMSALDDTAKGLSASTIQLVSAFKKLDEAQKIKSADDAIKTLDLLTKNTDSAKNAAIENKKAKAQEAIQFLRTAAAAAEYAATMVEVEIQEYSSAGATDKVNAALARRKELLDAATAATRKANEAEAAISAPGFKWDSSGAAKAKKDLMSLADFTKKFRTELDQMQGVSGSDFAKGLQDGLKSLRGELDKVKGVTKEVREGFEREFTFAFSDKAIRDVKQEMMGLNGQFAELAAIEIDQKVAAYAAALEKASPAAREAAASTEQYKAALEKKVATDNLQDQVSFFKELADLSGDYGLSLEYQNKLIDIQAQRYKALFANEPQLQGFVDQWAALAKNALNAQTAIERAVSSSWKKLEQGTGTGVDVMTAALGSVMDGYKNVAHSTAQIWGDFFTSFSKGAADSIGQAIVYGDDLGESLNNVAQQAIASLISSFMELAIQAAIVKPLMESLGLAMGDKGAGDTAAIQEKTLAEIASIAEISAARIAAMEIEAGAATASAATMAAAMAPIAAEMAAMWAEAAYLISVATEGGAATAGLFALEAGLVKIRASIAASGFDEGGYTGNGSTNSVVGVVHGQEYVLNAATTRSIGVSNLDAINASGSLASVFTGRTSALSNLERPQSGGDMYVNVVNNASDTTVSQQQSADANGNMRLDIIIDDIMAGKVVNGSTARSLQSAYGLRKTGFRV